MTGGPFRLLGDYLDRKITEAQTCPGCGCNADRWRDDCDCLRQGCVCAGAEDDPNPNWERQAGDLNGDHFVPDAAGPSQIGSVPAAEPARSRRVGVVSTAAWWRANEPAYDGSNDEFLAWLNGGKPATDEQKRFFAYRDAGYDGWLGPDSRPVDDTEQARLNASFGRQRPGDPGVDAGSGFDPPSAAEPYTAKPKGRLTGKSREGKPDWAHREPYPHETRPTAAPPTTTGSAGGTDMPNVDEARGAIMTAHRSAEQGLGELAQAHSSLEDAQNGLRYTTEGSNQAEADQAHAQLADAMNKIDEARQQVAAALAEFEGVAQRL